MNEMTLKKTALLTLACIGLAWASNARAAHAAEFLDPLAAEVAVRLENPDLTAPEQRALNSAAKTLNRNTKTLAADLGVLSSAAKTLSKTFPDDEPLAALGNDAVNNYVNEAQNQLLEVASRSGTNEVPRALSNSIAKAEAALVAASDTELTVSARARAAAKALAAVQAANRLSARIFKAPLSLDGTEITLDGRESDRDSFDGTLNSDGNYTIADNGEGEETGNWSYERTTATTGAITLNPTVGDVRALELKFAKSTKGTFTGQDNSGENVRGTFTITPIL